MLIMVIELIEVEYNLLINYMTDPTFGGISFYQAVRR